MSSKRKKRPVRDMAKETAAIKAREAEKRARIRSARAKKRKRILLIAGCAAAVCALGFGGYLFWTHSSFAQHRHIAVKTDHYAVNQAVFSCLYAECIESYDNYAASDPDAERYDPAKSLKKQAFSEKQSWYDYFLSFTEKNVESVLQMCEAAYDAGYTLPEDEQQAAREAAAALNLDRCPRGVTRADAEEAFLLKQTAKAYQKHYEDSITVSEQDISDYFTQNTHLFYQWDMQRMILHYGEGSAAKDEALANANRLCECRTPDAFRTAAESMLEEGDTPDSISVSGTGSIYPDSVWQWVLDEKNPPAIGDTFMVSNDDAENYAVWQLTKKPFLDESDTVDLRVLLLSAESYGSVEEAHSEAERLWEEFRKNGGTPEVFSGLAAEYSEDTKTYPDGGMLHGYTASYTAYGSKVAQWAFDAARKPGDTVLLDEENFVLLAYFEQDNPFNVWQYFADQSIRKEKKYVLTSAAAAKEVVYTGYAEKMAF